ncbi:MAG: sigma 54-interacting transcriptional regulator [Deltaproteobacteria bacterium]|nr:sigma 54-interacting transcriptional regulator [Deltaproteobacteria bacterium]
MQHRIVELALDLTGGLREEDRHRRILSALRESVGADAANLLRLEGRLLVSVVHEGLDKASADRRFHIDAYPVLRRILDTAGPYRITDPEGIVSEIAYAPDSPGAGKPLAVLVGITLRVEGTVVGLVTFSSSRARAFDDVDDETIEMYAALAAASMRTADLIAALEEAASTSRRIARDLWAEAHVREAGPLLGESPTVQTLRAQIEAASANTGGVLVTGAANTGKSVVASAVHAQSMRADEVFVTLDCGMASRSATDRRFFSPEPRWESSGSDRMVLERTGGHQIGRIEMADGGTIFLLDVEKLPEPTQDGMAEMINGMEAVRAQGRTPRPDVRVIASTTRDLEALVVRGRFREDLWDALRGNTIRTPLLRERCRDIPAIAEHFLHQHGERMGRRVERFSSGSLKRLQKHKWPGNLRELQNVLERVVLQTDGPVARIDETMLDETTPLGDTHYRLVKRIGEGGMGEVWLARHELLARPAAVKLIRPERMGELQEGSKAWRRFHLEAKATSKLRSPHTVELYDFGVGDTGELYFVMELLTGMDLGSLLEQEGPIPPARAIYLLKQACRSLAEAHEMGLVHRDVKPSNLIACRLGVEHDFLKVVDFGIVKAMADDAQITGSGVPTGTPAYIAPELALGEGPADGRADIYSLGATLWTLLTGKLVFGGASPIRQLMDHIQKAPEAPSSKAPWPLPPHLDELVLKCLEKDPAQRPQTALELWGELSCIEASLDHPWGPMEARDWWEDHEELKGDALETGTWTPVLG